MVGIRRSVLVRSGKIRFSVGFDGLMCYQLMHRTDAFDADTSISFFSFCVISFNNLYLSHLYLILDQLSASFFFFYYSR